MSELSKLDTLLQKTHIKVLLVLRLDMCRSILSFSTIAHQMWRDHLFSQRNRTTERREGVGLGVAGCVYVCVNVCVCACVGGGGEGGGQNLKKGRGQGMWGGFHKIGGLAPLWRLCKETWKISHPSHYKPPPPPFSFLAPPPFLVKISSSSINLHLFSWRYYISFQIDAAQDLIDIASRCIYSKLLLTLFSN